MMRYPHTIVEDGQYVMETMIQPVVIEMCFHYHRRLPVLNKNGVTTWVVIEIRSHYPRNGPMHNGMMLYMYIYGNDDKGTVTRPYFADGTRRGKQSKVRDK